MLTNKQEIIFFSSLGAIVLFFLIASYLISHSAKLNKSEQTSVPAPLQDVHISAKAAMVYDTLSGTVLYEKNADARLPLASLVKVMVALVARDIAPENSTVVISTQALQTEGDAGLIAGERWALKNLLDFSLVSSANDGVRAVALALGNLQSSTSTSDEIVGDFVHKMNIKAGSMGMKNTYYLNDTGLDESSKKGGAYGSARDMAMLFKYILKKNPSILAATRETTLAVQSEDGIRHIAHNTDLIINLIPGVIASKTGFTDLAGGNLVVAFDPEMGRPIIISILGSSEQGRFDDMLQLVKKSLESVGNSVQSKNK